MGTGTATNIELRIIPIAANERIGMYRKDEVWHLGLYRLARPYERATELSTAKLHAAAQKGLVPDGARRGWVAFTWEGTDLALGIDKVINDADSHADARTLRTYIRETEWGKDWL